MKKLILLFMLLTGQIIIAQTAQPLIEQPHLIWQNPDGTSGECYNQSGGQTPPPVCSTTICLGESICFSYDAQVGQTCDYVTYSCNHEILSFSDGGQITIENINYQGTNSTGCVNYAPATTGLITTTSGPNGTAFNIYVLPNTPPVLSANISPANLVCQGSQICAQSLTSPIISYNFSSNTAIACGNPVPCNTPNTSSFCFPVGNHQILYTVNEGHTCENSTIYNITVVAPTLNLTMTPPANCSDNYCFNATPSGCNYSNVSYQWTITGPINLQTVTSTPSFCYNLLPGSYYASVEILGSNPTVFKDITFNVNPIDPCLCLNCNAIGTSGIINSSPVSNQKYCINNNVTINGNVSFTGSLIKLGTNVTITVPNNAILNINNSYLFGDVNMWTGIVVQNGGKLNIINNSLIEDAKTAVSISNNTSTSQVLTVDASIFNKNQTDINITGYNQNIATYPFSVTNSLFTCRNIQSCVSGLTWPTTSTVKAATNPTSSPLESPYINNTTYPVTTLKAPFTGKKSYYGIIITNVGFSSVTTTSSSYKEIVIGTPNGINTYNVFDNHYISIQASGSNVSVVNSIFQNGYNLAFPSLYSVGIKAISPSTSNLRLQVNSTSYTNNNKFYDLTRAVFTQYMHDLNINYCEMYSKRVFNSSSASQFGAFGVSSMSNHYRNVNLNYNKIFNIDNALVFNAVVATYAVGTASGNGQFLGSINANNNIIRSHVTGYTPNPSLHYGFKAIALSSILGAANVTQAGQVVNANDNIIYDYENGIFCSNWPLQRTVAQNNNVTIRNTASAFQYGIAHDNNSDGSTGQATFASHGILNNVVSATSISANPSNYAIRSSQNTASAVRCNTVSNTYNGIAYSGTAVQGSFFQYNDFTGNNKYGFVLENAGVIGQQGGPNLGPTDNRWLGTSWVSPNFKTATLGTSSAVNSKVYIRLAPADFNPSNSAFTGGASGVTDYYYNGALGTLLQGNNASYVGCNWAKPLATSSNTNLATSNKFGTTPQDINLMEEIVMSQSTDPEQAQALSVAKEQVFVQLTETPDVMLNSTILSNYYNTTLNSNVAAFAAIEQDIAEGNKAAAQSNLVALTPQNTNAAKHKQFLSLLLKYNSQALSANDEQQLLSIANGCPSLEGTFVHEARTLYNVAFDKNNNFMDNCALTNNNARLAKTDEVKLEDEQFANSILLYPNPSHTGEVSILTDADTDALEVEINAVNGLNVLKQNVTLHNHAAKLNLKASEGVYIVIITNTKTKQRVTKKLVIQ